MASIKHLSRLFRAVAVRDYEQAVAAASEIADSEARVGHHSAAQILRGSLRPNGARVAADNGSRNGSMTAFSPLLSAALKRQQAGVALGSVVLTTSARSVLDELIREWRCRDTLRKARLARRSKVLFHGPPGCGKSLTACALGLELSLPVFVVRFDTVVGAYLGQTALHLRELFAFTETTPCVLLIDEVDALGKQRGNPLDVGELDRIVISLMQELEHSAPLGLVICTSNLPQDLDVALWRRFDVTVEFPRPESSDLTAFLRTQAESHSLSLTKRLRRLAHEATSYADVEKLVLDEARRRLLNSECVPT